jgi:hypothetical protein
MTDTPPVCNYEGSDYQTSFWEKGGRAYEDACEAIALKKLLPVRGDHLLELGAGAGRNTLRYTGYQQITLIIRARSCCKRASVWVTAPASALWPRIFITCPS